MKFGDVVGYGGYPTTTYPIGVVITPFYLDNYDRVLEALADKRRKRKGKAKKADRDGDGS